MAHLFTYGSLMFSSVWETIVSGNYPSTPAKLAGYQRFAVKGEDYPAIKPASEEIVVEGIVYFEVAGRDLTALDRFEGIYYQRSQVTLNTESGTLQAETYVLRPRFYSLASTKPWDVDHFSKRGIKVFMAGYKGF